MLLQLLRRMAAGSKDRRSQPSESCRYSGTYGIYPRHDCNLSRDGGIYSIVYGDLPEKWDNLSRWHQTLQDNRCSMARGCRAFS